jgi:hypothetical protein
VTVEKRSVEAIISALNAAPARYLVADGLAVVAHGYVRFTADIDLIIDLDAANVTRAMAALASLGYRPRAPVGLDEFADPAKRVQWVRDKGLTVFSLFSAVHPATEVDIFVESPLDFEQAYGGAVKMEIAPGVSATFVALSDLLRLKRQAGRAQDLLDIDMLSALGEGSDRDTDRT